MATGIRIAYVRIPAVLTIKRFAKKMQNPHKVSTEY